MKQLPSETNNKYLDGNDCASLLMEVVPVIMRYIRNEMRSHRTQSMSVPQFRTLVFINRNNGCSVSDIANNIGLTLPSASKIVDALVKRKLISRTMSSQDRRYSILKLTKLGRTTFAKAKDAAEASLAEKMAILLPDQKAIIAEAMQSLRPIFLPSAIPSGNSSN
jgi:DNA-binding MarR family transcriptional regulator